jgi:thioredoxin 1
MLPLISQAQSKEVKPKVTFIELCSVNCVPFKMMQPVMKAIEKNMASRLKLCPMMFG